MSISSEISRIQLAKANLRTSINAKGGTLQEDALLGAYATAVDNLPSGGDMPDNLSAFETDAWGNPKSITVKSGVTSIPSNQYIGNGSLTSATLSDTVTSIGSNAFNGCGNLASVNLGNGLTTINDGVFQNCSGLSSVTIPNSVTSIGQNAFTSCNDTGFTSITIPSGVTTIGRYCFSGCTNLKDVVISSSSITTIPQQCFMQCYSLSSITMPSSVTSIGDASFQYCYKLSSITIPDNVTSIANGAFYRCSGLTSINIPDKVASIGQDGFGYCSGITDVTIGTGFASLGNRVFQYCSSLSSITCNAPTAPTLGNTVFDRVSSTGVLYYPQGSNYQTWISALPTGWTTVETRFVETGGQEVCVGYDKCKPMKLQDYVGGQWQDHVPSLIEYIPVEELSTDCGFDESDFKVAFKQNNGLYVPLPVDGSSQLTSAETRPYYATAVDAVVLTSVTSIDSDAFRAFSVLTSTTIPDTVTQMGENIWQYCGTVQRITIGAGVSTIRTNTFQNCSSLSSITCYNKNGMSLPYYGNPFSGIKATGTLYVPTGSDYSNWTAKLPTGWTVSYITQAQYRWVDYKVDPDNLGDNFPVYQVNTNDSNNLYSLEKQQVSTDGGTTWSDVSPLNTRFGNEINEPFPPNQSYVSGSFYAFDMTSEICEENTTQWCDDEAYSQMIEGCEGDPDCEASINYEDFCVDSSEYTGMVTREFNIYTSINSGSTWSVSTTSTYDSDLCRCNYDPCICDGICIEDEIVGEDDFG